MKVTKNFRGAILTALVMPLCGISAFAQSCQNTCGTGFIDLSATTPAVPPVNASPDAQFNNRVQAAINFGMSCNFPTCADDCGRPDFGEEYQVRVFARLAAAAAGDKSKLQEALDSLANIHASDLGAIGTDSPAAGVCSVPDIGGPLATLINAFSNVARHGDGDTALIGFVNILYKFGPSGANILPQNVIDNLMSILQANLSPGLGGVEHLSFGIDDSVCDLAAPLMTGCGPLCFAACKLAASEEKLDTPESENHINMIYAFQYLTNQLWFQKTGDPKYDNAQNGYRGALLNRLKGFVRNDFIEYNAHNYEDFDMFALLSLASYASDPPVQAAANMVLDYISAKVAVSSNDARRSVPFRRRNEDKHTCSELIQQNCSDPQTAFYMMLAGNWDILQHSITSGISPDNSAPYSYGTEFLWAGTTNYKINPLILDLLVDRSHRNFYQFFHTSRKLEEDDFDDSVDELYAASPSYLLSAGSHGTHAAYTATVPWPFSLIPAFGINDELTGPFGVSHPSHDSDKGFAPPTTLMPTGAVHSRDDMIRFDASLCVAPNFACGSNPQIPGSYAPEVIGPWSFINRSAIAPNYGYYAAVFQGAGWGFLEACDTFIDPCKSKTYDDFKAAVQANNPDPTAFSNTGTNTYKTFDGKTIQFSIGDGMIVNINGQAPYDPNRTNGTIIDNNGAGTITITNPFRKDLGTNGTLTLDATVPPAHPQITIPGPLTFPDTCVGSKSLATLNICNDGNGTDNLTVYNILALTNNQFQVTEPTSGYPTTIGSNFCFPFQAQFAPVLTGAIADKLTISNSDPNVPELKLPVSGKGIQQAIGTVIANGGDFGNVCLGSYVDLNLTINNKGGCDLTITGITSDSADFGTAATVAFPLTIHAGTSLAVPIRFHPSKFGAAAAKITVANNDPATPNAVVPITGNAPAPVINASVVNNGNFGNVCAGAQADLALQVLNAGLCPLTISSVSSMQTAPAGGPSFLLPSVTAFPLVLSAGGSVNLPVRFQPPAYGSGNYITCSNAVAQAANVVIHSNDPHYPDPVGFVRSVGGIEGCPTLVLSPHDLTGAYAFPATVSDPNGTLGCYTDQQITVSNSGICPLTLASLATANGTDGKNLPLPGAPLEFKVVNPTTPVTIAPGASPVPITVRFKPIILANQSSSAPDQQTGMLSIVSNDPVAADNQAGLCGEPTYQSGARVLVVDTSTSPVSSLANLTLSSQGLTPTFKQTLMPAALRSAPNICGNTILYHLDNETLRPAGTTGNNPKASYQVSAKNGSTQANMSFTLGQCETKRIVLQIK